MTPLELDHLTKLSQAQQDADAAKLQAIHSEEQRIRSQLAALDATQDSARDLPALKTLQQRRVGGDLLWQRWVGRRRRELQMQLARCLARKATARRHLQKSFGKSSALQKLKTNAKTRKDHATNTRRFEAMTQIGVLLQSK